MCIHSVKPEPQTTVGSSGLTGAHTSYNSLFLLAFSDSTSSGSLFICRPLLTVGGKKAKKQNSSRPPSLSLSLSILSLMPPHRLNR